MNTAPTPSRAWYRHPLVWMLIAGPALVVVAAIYTAYLAMSAPDPVLAHDAYEYGQKNQAQTDRSLLPANQARNHAATPEGAPVK
jgi:uncharacterized protein